MEKDQAAVEQLLEDESFMTTVHSYLQRLIELKRLTNLFRLEQNTFKHNKVRDQNLLVNNNSLLESTKMDRDRSYEELINHKSLESFENKELVVNALIQESQKKSMSFKKLH